MCFKDPGYEYDLENPIAMHVFGDNYLILKDGKYYTGLKMQYSKDTIMYITKEGVRFTRFYMILDMDMNTDKGDRTNGCVLEAVSLPYLDRFGLFRFAKVLYRSLEHSTTCITSNLEQADVVHYHIVGPIQIPKEFEGKKIIAHFHGFKPENFEECKGHFDEIVYVSDYQRKVLFKDASGNIVWNAVEPYKQLRRIDNYHFMFAQSDYDAKNPEWIKENVKKYPEFRVAVAGSINIDGADNYGYLDMDDLHLLHASSQIFVMPSKKEAFGLAPAYAMLQGTVPAVSIHSGIAEFLPRDLTIIFEPEESTLKDIWNEYKNRKLYERREAIREHVKLIYPEKWAERMDAVFRKVL